MSGLVSGLQNRVRRFESARNLNYHFKTLESQALSRVCFYGDRFGDYLKIIVPAGCSRQFLHYGMVQ